MLHEHATMLVVNVNIIAMASIMFISYIILTVKLKLTKSDIKTSQSDHINFLITKVCWLMFSAWFVVCVPMLIISQVASKIAFTKSLSFGFDTAYLIFCLNNLTNPIVYCITMKDFRDGYKAILLCSKVKKRSESTNTMSRTGSTRVSTVSGT